MTSEVKVEPTAGVSANRILAGVVVGIGVLAVVAVPAMLAAYLSLALFLGGGCEMGCSDPWPLGGAVCGGVALILLSVPVIAGLATARVLTGRRWQIHVAAVTAGVMVAGLVLAALGLGASRV
jgi:hypothetical protein